MMKREKDRLLKPQIELFLAVRTSREVVEPVVVVK
jgi:hypothetical protein